jgi:uncharacterized protein (TIGR03437 family)
LSESSVDGSRFYIAQLQDRGRRLGRARSFHFLQFGHIRPMPQNRIVAAGQTDFDLPEMPTEELPDGSCFSRHWPYCPQIWVGEFDAELSQFRPWMYYGARTSREVLTDLAVDSAGRVYLAGGLEREFGVPEAGPLTLGRGFTFVARIAPSIERPAFHSLSVINSATFGGVYRRVPGVLAPGMLATIYGTGFGAKDIVQVPSRPGQTELAGTRVLVNGSPAPILALARSGTEDQINFVVPWNPTLEPIPADPWAPRSIARLTVESAGRRSLSVPVQIRAAQFKMFRFGERGTPAIVHADGSLVSDTHPAVRGEMLSIYGTSLGAVSPSLPDGQMPEGLHTAVLRLKVQFTAGGFQSEPFLPVEWAGLAPGFLGVYQINVRVPEETRPGRVTMICVFDPEVYSGDAASIQVR